MIVSKQTFAQTLKTIEQSSTLLVKTFTENIPIKEYIQYAHE